MTMIERIKEAIRAQKPIRFSCKVLPQSSYTRIEEVVEVEELKIHLTTAPTKGKANQHLIELLAAEFACKKHAITILRGTTSHHKIIQISP